MCGHLHCWEFSSHFSSVLLKSYRRQAGFNPHQLHMVLPGAGQCELPPSSAPSLWSDSVGMWRPSRRGPCYKAVDRTPWAVGVESTRSSRHPGRARSDGRATWTASTRRAPRPACWSDRRRRPASPCRRRGYARTAPRTVLPGRHEVASTSTTNTDASPTTTLLVTGRR